MWPFPRPLVLALFFSLALAAWSRAVTESPGLVSTDTLRFEITGESANDDDGKERTRHFIAPGVVVRTGLTDWMELRAGWVSDATSWDGKCATWCDRAPKRRRAIPECRRVHGCSGLEAVVPPNATSNLEAEMQAVLGIVAALLDCTRCLGALDLKPA